MTYHGALALFKDKRMAEMVLSSYEKVYCQSNLAPTIELVKVVPYTINE